MAKNKVKLTGVNTNDIIVLTSKETNELFKNFRNTLLSIILTTLKKY